MRRRKLVSLGILSLCFVPGLAAAVGNPGKMDFAYGINVQLQPHQLYEFVVNPQMYRYLQQADLRDLRVFDDSGTMVPLDVLQMPAREETVARESKVQPLVFFTLDEINKKAVNNSVTVQNVTSKGQQSTTVRVESEGTAPSGRDTQYVIDLESTPGVARDLDVLRLDWNTHQVPKVNVTVQTSEDLTQWQEAAAASLYHLQVKEHRLLRAEFALRKTKRYLLIRAQDNPDFELKSVHALQKPQRQTKDNAYTARAELLRQEGNAYDYRIPGKLRLRAIRLYPGDTDAVYGVLLFSGQDANTMDRVHFQGSIYNLTVEDERVHSPFQSLSFVSDSYWRLQVLDNNQPGIKSAPVLEYRYYPHRVRFLSNRQGNYIIAFGSGKVLKPAPALPATVKDASREITSLELPPARLMGGLDTLEPRPQAADSRKIVLWAVLFLVLGVMVYMVLRLIRHMRQDQAEP